MNQQFISKQGLIKLREELDYLKNTKRRQIAERLKRAIEQGDLAENAEYHDAKDAQAWTEGRIAELESKIKNAQIIRKGHNGHVAIGSKIKVKTGRLEIEYEIVGSQEADPSQGRISNESPLGQAFLGHKKGDKVEVQTPEGVIKYKILAIS